MPQLLLREDGDGVVKLTLNRPDKLNALSPDLFVELSAEIADIRSRAAEFSCVVLAGAGRSFCAGADLEALKAGHGTADPELRARTVQELSELPLLVIARVHGHCYTGGLELALAADLIVAAEDSKFCDTHAKIGGTPKWGMTARLPRRIGLAAAKRLLLTSLPIDGREAHRLGLADICVPAPELDEVVDILSAAAAANSRHALAATKMLLARAMETGLAEALRIEREFEGGKDPEFATRLERVADATTREGAQ